MFYFGVTVAERGDLENWDFTKEEVIGLYIDLKEQLVNQTKELDEVLKYCQPYTDQMWSAKIISTILGCDFRDAKFNVDNYFKGEIKYE